MSQPVLLKVYGNLFPVDEAFASKISDCCASALGDARQEIVSLQNRLLLISFEGIYFPLAELLETIEAFLKSGQAGLLKGKVDTLDLEAWTLERFLVEDGRIIAKSAPLNNVLDYSGH